MLDTQQFAADSMVSIEFIIDERENLCDSYWSEVSFDSISKWIASESN